MGFLVAFFAAGFLLDVFFLAVFAVAAFFLAVDFLVGLPVADFLAEEVFVAAFRILSLDGGGVRGVFSTRVLERIAPSS